MTVWHVSLITKYDRYHCMTVWHLSSLTKYYRYHCITAWNVSQLTKYDRYQCNIRYKTSKTNNSVEKHKTEFHLSREELGGATGITNIEGKIWVELHDAVQGGDGQVGRNVHCVMRG